MNDAMVRTLLAIAGVLFLALLVGMFTGPGRGLALSAAAVFCLVACRMRWVESDAERGPRPPGETITALERLWARALERLRPETPVTNAADLGSASSCGICVLDREYRVLWCNRSAATHFGMRLETATGRPFVHAGDIAAYVTAADFSKPLSLGGGWDKDSTLAISLVPYLKSQWLLLSRDATPETRAETVRRNGVADALHELCTPVTVLAGYLDTLNRLKLDPWRSHDYLNAMEDQCRRMQKTIEDLLDLWTLDATQTQTRHERVDTGALLARIRADIEALSAGRLRVSLDARPGLALVGAEKEIASAFSNLAINAVRYTPAGGEVRLIWRATDDGAEFCVEDTGIGIAKEHIPRLTERFFRVNREFSRKYGGSGLGLAIVKDVLTRHQATLTIESEPGQGSRFTAKFPAHRILLQAAPVQPVREERPASAVVIPFGNPGGKVPAAL